MSEIVGYGLIVVWFVFWGWMLATRPEVVFRFWKQSNEQMEKAAKVAGKTAVFGLKIMKK